METSKIFIAFSIIALALIVLSLFVIRGKTRKNKLTPLAGLAFGFVLAAIIFGNERILGYSLIGIGIILSVLDIIQKRNNDKRKM